MKRLLIILFVVTVSIGFAQEMDSVLLDEVVFSAPKFTKYSAGAKVVKLGEGIGAENLNDAMAFLPSITFKNYGNGGLSTISFRGTSASHTQLLWNGIPVNSPTLGQSDFSLFPTFMMDEISVQYGSTSALTGSGAIGGTVAMSDASPRFGEKLQAQIALRYGSFGRIFTGAKFRYGGKRFHVKTKVYRQSIRNNFPYPEKGSDRILIQENAAVRSYGVEQQLHTKLGNTQLLSITGFYNFNHREIQPNVASIGNDETLQDDNTRVVATYSYYSKFGFWEAKLGYVYNDQLYNKTSQVRSEQWISKLNWDKDIGNKVNIRAGVSHQYIVPKTASHTIDAKENRTELYGSLQKQITEAWKANLNLRQAIYDGELVPFTPSIGQEYKVVIKKSTLTFKNRIGRAYRTPTLNDRFWIEGGNSELKPEESWNVEFGFDWTRTFEKNVFSSEATVYHQNVDDWILWKPDNIGVWSPGNIQRVVIDGLELNTKYTVNGVRHSFDFLANYSLTRSVIKEDNDESFVNNLLPYVSQHKANFHSRWKTSNWSNSVSANYIGKRYIEKSNNEFQSIEGVLLINYKLTRQLELRKINLNMMVEVNNILNTYYEQLKNHAMPGRNYAINLSINI